MATLVGIKNDIVTPEERAADTLHQKDFRETLAHNRVSDEAISLIEKRTEYLFQRFAQLLVKADYELEIYDFGIDGEISAEAIGGGQQMYSHYESRLDAIQGALSGMGHLLDCIEEAKGKRRLRDDANELRDAFYQKWDRWFPRAYAMWGEGILTFESVKGWVMQDSEKEQQP